ncbi:hypothetical protein HYW53_02735 [Candidatus Giovannonibacteria bacterium]|nr:hypothetical protein [Candidatus Giovannonibacteria bacterium]
MFLQQENADEDEKIATIRAFVEAERKKAGLVGFSGALPEMSCIAEGEFHNLLWRKLMRTPVTDWFGELDDPEVLDGVYRCVRGLSR